MLRSRLVPSSSLSAHSLRNQSQITPLAAGQKRFASYKEIKASLIPQISFSLILLTISIHFYLELSGIETVLKRWSGCYARRC
jgi:hypothetical protein